MPGFCASEAPVRRETSRRIKAAPGPGKSSETPRVQLTMRRRPEVDHMPLQSTHAARRARESATQPPPRLPGRQKPDQQNHQVEEGPPSRYPVPMPRPWSQFTDHQRKDQYPQDDGEVGRGEKHGGQAADPSNLPEQSRRRSAEQCHARQAGSARSNNASSGNTAAYMSTKITSLSTSPTGPGTT